MDSAVIVVKLLIWVSRVTLVLKDIKQSCAALRGCVRAWFLLRHSPHPAQLTPEAGPGPPPPRAPYARSVHSRSGLTSLSCVRVWQRAWRGWAECQGCIGLR